MTTRTWTRIRATVVAAGFAAAGLAGQAFGQDETVQEMINLGDRESGRSYPLALAAQNLNCEQPIDMRFEALDTPWLRFEAGNVARGVNAGEAREVPITLDFTGVPAGPRQGRVRVVCENCGILLWQNCYISDRELVLAVNVVGGQPPAQPSQPAPGDSTIVLDAAPPPPPPPAPGGAGASGVESGSSQYVDPAVEAALAQAQRDALNGARARAAATAAALVALQARRDPCEEELARLRAARDAAEAAAQQAEAAAAAADADAAAADQHLADFQDELDAASARMDSTYRTLQMQAAARTIVGNEHGLGSPQYAEADGHVDRANDAAVEAQREFSAIRATYEARQQAAEAARAAAEAAQASAAAARAQANAAQEAVDAKERECLGLAQQVQDAVSEAAEARDEAEEAAGGAPAQALANLDEQIANARASCAACWRNYQRLAEAQRQALLALAALGAFRDNPAAQPDIMGWGQLVFNTLTEMAATATGVSSFQSGLLLGGLEAAYRGASIIQSEMTPWTARYNADATTDWLDRHDYDGPNATADEIREQMELFMSEGRNAAVFTERLNRLRDQCLRCEERVRQLEAQRAEVAAQVH